MSWNGLQMASDRADVSFQVDIPPEMMEGMTTGGNVAVRISRREALQVPAVLRSRNLIAGTLATLPIHIRDKNRKIATPTTLLEQIDPDVPNVVIFALTYEDLLFESVSWWKVTERGFHGYPTYAEHLDVQRVHIYDGKAYVDGRPVADDQVIRFDSPNPPLLTHAARAIRTCLSLDLTAAGYSNDPMPLGYFTPKEGMRPKEDKATIEQMLDRWEEARRRRVWGYIGSAWEAKQFMFNAEQIQLAEQRQHAVLEIARAAGVDPEDLGVSTTSRTYQNAEQRRQDLIDFTFHPYMTAMEQRLSMRDILPRGYEAKVNMDGFLRGDTKARYESYEIALKNGFETLEEVRDLEDRPSLPKPRVPAPLLPETNGQVPSGQGAMA